MAEIAKWNDHIFEVSPEKIMSFTNMTIKASCDTEDKTGDGEKYVSKKNAGVAEIGIEIELSAFAGADVREECDGFINDAQNGEQSYFYIGSEKLVPCQLMLTTVNVSNITILPNGTWISASLKLTFKQCSKWNGKLIKKKKKKSALTQEDAEDDREYYQTSDSGKKVLNKKAYVAESLKGKTSSSTSSSMGGAGGRIVAMYD